MHALSDTHSELLRLGAPDDVCLAMSPKSALTLMVETFFISMRATHPNPYALQYAQHHTNAMLLERLRALGSPWFSYWTQSLSHSSRPGRDQYSDPTGKLAPQVFPPRTPKPREEDSTKGRRRSAEDLAKQQNLRASLFALAALYKQVRQGKVTDRKKEMIGARPTRTYDPQPLPASQDGAEGDVLSEDEFSAAPTRPKAPQRGPLVLYRSGQLLVIKPDRAQGEVWFAQLLEPIVARSSMRRNFNVERPSALYYVASHSLDTWSAACAYWGRVEALAAESNYNDDRAAWEKEAVTEARALAAATSGVHFSYAGHVEPRARRRSNNIALVWC